MITLSAKRIGEQQLFNIIFKCILTLFCGWQKTTKKKRLYFLKDLRTLRNSTNSFGLLNAPNFLVFINSNDKQTFFLFFALNRYSVEG